MEKNVERKIISTFEMTTRFIISFIVFMIIGQLLFMIIASVLLTVLFPALIENRSFEPDFILIIVAAFIVAYGSVALSIKEHFKKRTITASDKNKFITSVVILLIIYGVLATNINLSMLREYEFYHLVISFVVTTIMPIIYFVTNDELYFKKIEKDKM